MKSRLIKFSFVAALAMFFATEQALAANDPSYRREESRRDRIQAREPERIDHSKVVYKEPTPVVQAVRTLPPTATPIKHKGNYVYFHDGRYYRREADRYIAVPAPVGVKVENLPLGAKLLRLLDAVYYYCEGTYYAPSRNEYVVVDVPQNITVSTLPAEADQITIDGKDYYIYNGTVYSIVLTPEGKVFQSTGTIGL